MLNVHAFGPARAQQVLALHGVTAHGNRYRRFAGEGLPELRVLAPDLRGHGHSTWEPPWTVEQHVSDLLELLDAEDAGRIPVVGHSMGGMIGLHLALAAPERVARLVLLDPVLGVAGEEAFSMAESTRLDNGWTTEEEARAERRSGHPESAYPSIDQDLADVLSAGGDGLYRLRFCRSAAVCGWSEMARPVPDCSGLAVPTLVVIAIDDSFDKQPVLDALAAAPAPVTVERLDSGHMLYSDAFDETVSLVRGFIGA